MTLLKPDDLLYCPGVINYGDILSKCFKIDSPETLNENYQKVTQEFQTNTPGGLITIPKLSCLPVTSCKEFIADFINPAYTAGIDMPVLVQKKDCPIVKIAMVIGEDPLRKGTFEGKEEENIILSTPFGTHNAQYRRRSGKLYWQLFEQLIANEYAIYITDIKKLWLAPGALHQNSKGGPVIKSVLPKDLLSNFYDTLEFEVDVLSAIADLATIITFGSDAEELINTMKTPRAALNRRNIVSFIHPTFSARSHWKRRFGWDKARDAYVLAEMMEKLSLKRA